MANNNKHTGPNVPALRFPEFSGEWECVPLSTYAKKITEKNKGNKIKNVLCNSATQGIVPQSEYFDREIANNENTDGYYVVRNQDFVYNPRKSVSAPYGPVNIYNGEDDGIISPLYLCMKIRGIDKNFLLHYFKSPAWYPYIYQNGDSGVRHDRVSIKDEVFLAMPVSVPNGDEQRKIAKFLDAINERIATQSKIIEELTALRSALTEKCSRQAGTLFSLADILEETDERSTVVNQYQVLSSTVKGIFSQKEYFNKDIASEDNKGYKVVRRGNVVLSPQNLWMGNINYNNRYDVGIVSPSYKIYSIKKGFNPTFIAALLKSKKALYEYMLASEQGASVVRRNLNVEAFMGITFRIPNAYQQEVLSKAIAAIDSKLSNELAIFEQLQLQKGSLLENMFI